VKADCSQISRGGAEYAEKKVKLGFSSACSAPPREVLSPALMPMRSGRTTTERYPPIRQATIPVTPAPRSVILAPIHPGADARPARTPRRGRPRKCGGERCEDSELSCLIFPV
jgi:hypothetical protein